MRKGIGAMVLVLGVLVIGRLPAQTTSQTSSTQTQQKVLTQTYNTTSGTTGSWFTGLLGGGGGFGSNLLGNNPYRAPIPGTVTSTVPDPTDAKAFLANWKMQRPFHPQK
jgi:hypothetical protein